MLKNLKGVESECCGMAVPEREWNRLLEVGRGGGEIEPACDCDTAGPHLVRIPETI